MDLDLNLESLARDLDLSNLQYLLARRFRSRKPFASLQVEVEETVVDLPPEQVRRAVDLQKLVQK